MNADPNYGTLWFYCRPRPIDTPSSILRTALNMLIHELSTSQQLYLRGIFRYVKKCLLSLSPIISPGNSGNTITSKDDLRKKQTFINDLSISTLREILEDFETAEKESKQFHASSCISIIMCSETIYTSTDFVSGIIELNRRIFNKSLNEEDRRKVLFGADQITP